MSTMFGSSVTCTCVVEKQYADDDDYSALFRFKSGNMAIALRYGVGEISNWVALMAALGGEKPADICFNNTGDVSTYISYCNGDKTVTFSCTVHEGENNPCDMEICVDYTVVQGVLQELVQKLTQLIVTDREELSEDGE